eukprot:333200_1
MNKNEELNCVVMENEYEKQTDVVDIKLVLLDYEDLNPFINCDVDVADSDTNKFVCSAYNAFCNMSSGDTANSIEKYKDLYSFAEVIKHNDYDIESRKILNFNFLYNILYHKYG